MVNNSPQGSSVSRVFQEGYKLDFYQTWKAGGSDFPYLVFTKDDAIML